MQVLMLLQVYSRCNSYLISSTGQISTTGRGIIQEQRRHTFQDVGYKTRLPVHDL